jgi:outer membrane protein assembly factor BamD
MRTKMLAPGALLLATLATGCSSLPVPSLPWSKSAPASDPTAEALFEEGSRYFNEKRYVRALDAFNRLKTEQPFSPLLTETELKIADAYYLNEQYPEAINAFKEFESLHPTSEHLPFVILRLGQAHFNQFTAVNRDQKNTEIAKGYFEALLTNHPKSPYAAEAKENLAKCNGILAEHEFDIAEFYFKHEKYPAARDRFEEIVRKYRGTPVASRSLFYLGESYRKEKNNVKAALAYEALLQHYPDDRFSPAARAQLAQIEKEKNDPLAMLLMRDRRPVTALAAAEAKPEATAGAKPKAAMNLVAKTEVVYEAPGEEKGIFSRVVDKINPFSSSTSEKKKEEEKPQTAVELLAKNNKPAKTESNGFFTSLWPFGGGSDSKASSKEQPSGKNDGLLASVDESLKQRGIDAKSQTVALKAPAIDLPKGEDPEPQQRTTDTGQLLGQIDSSLKKEGKSPGQLPAPPQAAEVFRNPEAAQAVVAAAKPKTEAEQGEDTRNLLSSIDQKLKGQGVGPGNFEPPPVITQTAATKPVARQEINLEPKHAVEKGPLFLSPAAAPAIEQSTTESAQKANSTSEPTGKSQDPAAREIPKQLVLGPQQSKPETSAPKVNEEKKPSDTADEENKGALDQLKQDLDSVHKLLNPFRW